MLFFIIGAFALWVIAFYPFIIAKKQIVDDAIPYYEHIKFFLDNITAGVYPLWDPIRDFGVDNEFYLRRIGEFNPAYLLIVVLQKCGLSFIVAHHVFYVAYFMLGVAGFYFLAKRLFNNPLTTFFIVACVLFSSLGALIFESYLLLILIPQIWFLYFFFAFFEKPAKAYALGAVFCLMIICITYIPYYFFSNMLCALIALGIIFKKDYVGKFRQCGYFLIKHKLFSIICGGLLTIGLIPGALWYQQASKGEMTVLYRHSGAASANASALHINVVNEGGIIAPMIADKMFFDLDQARPGDFYLPVFIALMLLVGAFVGINRRMVFFFCWGIIMYLIAIADASPLHRFLYNHISFFKYFRNLQFFLWLGIFPTLVFLLAEIFNRLVNVVFITRKSATMYLLYVTVIHAIALFFFLGQEINVVITSTYVVIGLSFLFFMSLPFKNRPGMQVVLPMLLLASVGFQSMEVFKFMERNTPDTNAITPYDSSYMQFKLPATGTVGELLKNMSPERRAGDPVYLSPDRYLNQPFYSSQQFQDLHQNLNRSVLALYIKPRLLLYDDIRPMNSNVPDLHKLSDAFEELRNIAYVSDKQMNHLHATYARGQENVWVITKDSAFVHVESFSANRLVLSTYVDEPKFLVYNNVYHSQWRAYCDGKPVTIFRANHAFMGVEVPAGHHTLEFIYQKAWRIWLGFALEIIFLGTLIGVIALLCRRKI